MIIGHKKNIEFLEQARSKGVLPNTLLFVGQEGVGKLKFAFGFAKWVAQNETSFLEASGFENGENRDNNVFYFNSPSIADIRSIRSKVAKTSFNSAFRIIIIDSVEKIRIEAANAFLKVLEEPRSDTFFCLLSSRESRVIPTIRSRCLTLYFGLIPLDQIQQNLDIDKVKNVALWWEGRPRIAQDLINNEALARDIEKMFGDASLFYQRDLTFRFSLLDKYNEKNKIVEFIKALFLLKRAELDDDNSKDALKYIQTLLRRYEANSSINIMWGARSFATRV